MGFVHLHCHSGYSLLEGTATPAALVGMARRLKMPALALTDRNNLYGAVHFYAHALKAGIKPVIGMEVDLDDGHSLVLLARNMDGYRNLCHLATILRLHAAPEEFQPAGFDDEDEILPWDPGMWGVPVFGLRNGPDDRRPTTDDRRITHHASRITQSASKIQNPKSKIVLPKELLLSGRHARGLVALSGGRHGLVNSLAREGKMSQAARAAGMLLCAFGEGNFFIELQALDDCDLSYMPALVDMANDLGIPIVATNDVLYLQPEDAPTAEALAAARIRGQGYERQRGAVRGHELDNFQNPKSKIQNSQEVGTERWFKSSEEMASLFHKYPQAIANAGYIAEQCSVELPLDRPQFPVVELRGETAFSRLWKLCFAGATRLYRPLTEAVIARLKYELEVIEGLGFSPYFLVVYDIVHFARSRDIPIMARGSAANSLVAYVLGITQVDPLRHDLLFERFLSSSRAEFELPDVDLDLCWRRRDEVLHYVYERYGRDHVAIVGTYITFRLRSAWREMAKALGISPQRVSYVASRLPDLVSAEDALEGEEDLNLTTDDRRKTNEEDDPSSFVVRPSSSARFRDETEERALELCKAIEGLPRHAGMHCAGVVIAPGPIADLVPLQRAARDPTMAITQYDKDAIERLGLVKMDLLGSRALTTLVDSAVSSGLARGKGDVAAVLDAIPFDDERAYRMMAEGDTLGCFQLESPGMRGLLKWLRPRSLGDVTAAISLFRPGPMEGGFLDIFMRRRLGQEPVSFHHPAMEPIISETYGVIIYQEQFLKLAHSLAGMDLGEAEKLRKELGKSHSDEERTRLGSAFVAGAIERGIDQMQAEKVWEIIAGYTGFGFCKAHACSYALTAYRSAYMKAHYPAHYLAAVINNQAGYYGPAVYVEDARRLGIGLLPPHVNLSGALCEVTKRSIRFGLAGIRGMSGRTVDLLLSERRRGGPFRSLADLVSRVRTSLAEAEALVKVGACDALGVGGWAECEAEPGVGEDGFPTPGLQSLPINRKQMLWLLPYLHHTLRSNGKRSTGNGAVGSLDPKSKIQNPKSVQVMIGADMDEHATAESSYSLTNGSDLGYSTTFRLLGEEWVQALFRNPQDPERSEVRNDYTLAEKLQLEREMLGFVVSHCEMDLYREAAQSESAIPAGRLAEYAGRTVTVAGVAAAARKHMAKDGEWMLFLTLHDGDGLIETVLFPEAYKKHWEALANAGRGPYLVKGLVQVSGKGRGIGVQLPAELRPTDAAAMKMHPVVIVEEVRGLEEGSEA